MRSLDFEVLKNDKKSPKEEVAASVSTVKRNTYETVLTGPPVDALGHHSKRHTQSPRPSMIKGVLQMD